MADDRYYRRLDLTIISAQNLKKPRSLFHTRFHARITVGGDKTTEKRTPADKHNGANPAWNHRVWYEVKESGITKHGVPIVIKMYCTNKCQFGDKYFGEFHTTVKELFDYGQSAVQTVPIKKGAGDTIGFLKFSYNFGERKMVYRPPFYVRMVETGTTLWLRDKVGKMVIACLCGPGNRLNWLGRRLVGPDRGDWSGPEAMIRGGDM